MPPGNFDDLMRQLIAGFAIEADERLQLLNEHLLALEGNPDPDESARRLKAIFREAHTLKGTAGGLGLKDAEAISHRLESLFGQVQSGGLTLPPDTFDLIYQSLDAIGQLVRAAAEPSAEAGVDVNDLVARLDAAISATGSLTPSPTTVEISPPPTPDPQPEPAPPPAAGPIGADPEVERFRRLLQGFAQEAAERLAGVEKTLKSLRGEANLASKGADFGTLRNEFISLRDEAEGLELKHSFKLSGSVVGALSRAQSSPGNLVAEDVASLEAAASLLLDLLAEETDSIDPVPAPETLAGVLKTLQRVATQRTTTAPVAVEPPPKPVPADPPPPSPTPKPASRPEPAPVAASESTPEPPPPKPAPKPTAPSTTPKPPDETIRVSVAKLDVMMAQVGELQVTHTGSEQRLTEIAELLEIVEAWEERWRKVRPESRKFLSSIPRGSVRPVEPASGEKNGTAVASPPSRTLRTIAEFLESNESSLKAVLARLNTLRRFVQADHRRMSQVALDLQEDVRRIRMRPIGTVFDSFPRMVRDIARSVQKEVALVIEGGEHEMDRSVLEQIQGPLVHLIRNSIDHGLESPEDRVASGKPRQGTLRITASPRGASLQIEVVDDGAGINPAKVKASAVKKGVLTADSAAALSEHEALWLIFRPGFSTRNEVTDLSGRGVGLDAVHEVVEQLGGLIDLESTPGKGTRFTLSLPMAVATTLCMLVRSVGRTFGLPVHNVVRIGQIKAEDIGRAGGRPVIVDAGRPIPLARLDESLDLPGPADQGRTFLVLGSADSRVAFMVDSVLGIQDVVIKALPAPLSRVPRIAGAAILGNGEVVVVLSVPELLRSLRSGAGMRSVIASPAHAPKEKAPEKTVILVADDSFTTRTLEKNILESAGYDVRVAADGLEAWRRLQEGGIDLLVSDVNMPNMDGFELTAKVRSDATLKMLPVVLVTSLDSQEDREMGVRAGADAHIVKGSFDQDNLLDAIRRLIV